ncbi:hypothetical protein ACHAQH_007176 [Verticillium albo-atrum]
MPLCQCCEVIDLDRRLDGVAQPWGRTTTGLRLSAESCELCAALVAACLDPGGEERTVVSRKLDGNRSLLDEEKPLYFAWSRDLDDTAFLGRPADPSRGRKLTWLTLFTGTGVDDAVVLNTDHGPGDAKIVTLDDERGWSFADPRLDRALSQLSIACDTDAPLELADRFTGRLIKPADDTAKAKFWIETCRSDHAFCRTSPDDGNGTTMPTRVIDVTQDGQPVRLIDTNGAIGHYVALSHRWGGANFIRTTSLTLQDHRDGIPLDDLCATLKDSVVMTRRLGFQYVWIDSLCIIQDDAEDWEREGATMASVYRNAAVTLAASCAVSGDTGLFLERNPGLKIKMPYRSPEGEVLGEYYLLHRTAQPFSNEVVDGSLNTRGWGLQERFLSRRILHFGMTQVFWECQTRTWSEAGTDRDVAPDRFDGGWQDQSEGFVKHLARYPWKDLAGTDSPDRQARRDEYSAWYTLTDHYSNRDLTVGDDKLPAISGLAHVFRSFREDQYLAGIWRGDLPLGLLWCAEAGKSLERPPKYRAPSWSWASRDGCIQTHRSSNGRIEVEVLDAFAKPRGIDPYGRVTSGSLHLRGTAAVLRLGKRMIPAASEFSFADSNVQLLDEHEALVGNASLDNHDELGSLKNVICLMLFRVWPEFRPILLKHIMARGDFAWCLLLRPLENPNAGVFERVGLAQIHQAVFEEREKETFEIL